MSIIGIIYTIGCIITFLGVLEWANQLEEVATNEIWDDFRYGTKWRNEQENELRRIHQLKLQDRAAKLRKGVFITAFMWPLILCACAVAFVLSSISKKHV